MCITSFGRRFLLVFLWWRDRTFSKCVLITSKKNYAINYILSGYIWAADVKKRWFPWLSREWCNLQKSIIITKKPFFSYDTKKRSYNFILPSIRKGIIYSNLRFFLYHIIPVDTRLWQKTPQNLWRNVNSLFLLPPNYHYHSLSLSENTAARQQISLNAFPEFSSQLYTHTLFTLLFFNNERPRGCVPTRARDIIIGAGPRRNSSRGYI